MLRSQPPNTGIQYPNLIRSPFSIMACSSIVDEPVVRVPAEHVQRLGDEVGQRVDVVEPRHPVAVVDHHFDPADVESRAAAIASTAAMIAASGVDRVIAIAARPGLHDAGIGRAQVEGVAAAVDLDRVEVFAGRASRPG